MISTPTELKAMRRMLGLDHAQAAELFGCKPETVRTYERPSCHVVFRPWADQLDQMGTYFEAYAISFMTGHRRHDEFLISYKSDAEFRKNEVELAPYFIFATVHLAALATVKMQAPNLTLVQMDESDYWQMALDRGWPSNPRPTMCQEWAASYVSRYKVVQNT